jgi:hypothetical protein
VRAGVAKSDAVRNMQPGATSEAGRTSVSHRAGRLFSAFARVIRDTQSTEVSSSGTESLHSVEVRALLVTRQQRQRQRIDQVRSSRVVYDPVIVTVSLRT